MMTRHRAPGGTTAELVHLTGTTGMAGPVLRSARTCDGWHVIARHPSGIVLAEVRVDGPLTDGELLAVATRFEKESR